MHLIDPGRQWYQWCPVGQYGVWAWQFFMPNHRPDEVVRMRAVLLDCGGDEWQRLTHSYAVNEICDFVDPPGALVGCLIVAVEDAGKSRLCGGAQLGELVPGILGNRQLTKDLLELIRPARLPNGEPRSV